MNNFPLQGSPYNLSENDNYIEKKKRNTTIRNTNLKNTTLKNNISKNEESESNTNVKNMIGSIHNANLSDDIDLADFNPPPHAEVYSLRNQSQAQIKKGIEIANMGELNPNFSNYHVTQLDVGEERVGPVNVEGFNSGNSDNFGNAKVDNSMNKPSVVTYTGANNYVGPYKQTVPYYTQMSNKDQLLEKLNYMIHLLEEQQDEKTGHVMEELILYSFLGVFLIFIVDSFARAGKYKR
jgi:hypothetical protein